MPKKKIEASIPIDPGAKKALRAILAFLVKQDPDAASLNPRNPADALTILHRGAAAGVAGRDGTLTLKLEG